MIFPDNVEGTVLKTESMFYEHFLIRIPYEINNIHWSQSIKDWSVPNSGSDKKHNFKNINN